LRDGQAALDYFFPPQEVETRHPSPVLILLDMNLPGVNGREVLARLKSNEHTRHIPVIVLTTTDDPDTVEDCYKLGCNMYFIKPLDYDLFMQALQTLGILLSRLAIPKGPPHPTSLP
jgi:CheY-like chemotaxis protein